MKNDREVSPPSTREAVEDKDEAITARVQKQIAKDSHLQKANIAVQTNAGIVSLTEPVPEGRQLDYGRDAEYAADRHGAELRQLTGRDGKRIMAATLTWLVQAEEAGA